MSAGIPNGSHRSGALSVEAITRQIRLHSGWRRQLAAIGTKNISARLATVRRSNQRSDQLYAMFRAANCVRWRVFSKMVYRDRASCCAVIPTEWR
jgi:hypothetical protein